MRNMDKQGGSYIHPTKKSWGYKKKVGPNFSKGSHSSGPDLVNFVQSSKIFVRCS